MCTGLRWGAKPSQEIRSTTSIIWRTGACRYHGEAAISMMLIGAEDSFPSHLLPKHTKFTIETCRKFCKTSALY